MIVGSQVVEAGGLPVTACLIAHVLPSGCSPAAARELVLASLDLVRPILMLRV